jgi:hypothetical protein
VEKITLDPTNNLHLVVSFHQECTGTPLPGASIASDGGWGCLAESTDAGQTWSLTTSALPWQNADGVGQSLVDATTWFYATNGCDGVWRTTTAGVSPDGHSPAWTQVETGGCVSGTVYQASNGVFFTSGQELHYSTDGITWMQENAPSTWSVNGSSNMTDDGQTFYIADGGGYYTAPLVASGALSFTQIASTPITSDYGTSPVQLGYDGAHKVLYSNNMTGGFWRYVAQ